MKSVFLLAFVAFVRACNHACIKDAQCLVDPLNLPLKLKEIDWESVMTDVQGCMQRRGFSLRKNHFLNLILAQILRLSWRKVLFVESKGSKAIKQSMVIDLMLKSIL